MKEKISKPVFKNTLVQLLGRALILILSLIATGFLTRSLGIAVFGDYVFLTAFFSFLVALSDWGTPFIGVREISRQKQKEKKKAFFINLVFLRTYFLLAALFLGFLAVSVIPLFKDLKELSFLCLLALVLSSGQISLTTLFQALLHFDWQTLSEIFNSALFLFLILTPFFRNRGLLGVILSLVIARALTLFWVCFKAKEWFSDFRKKNFRIISFLAREALPTGGLLFLSTAYDRLIDASFLRFFWDSSAVGIYGLAYKLYANLILPAFFLARSLFPFFSQKKDSEKQKAAFRLGVIWSLLGAFGVISISWLLAPLAVSLLAGEAFFSSVWLLRILLFSLPFTYLNHIFGFRFIAHGKQILSLKIGLFSLLWNLVLNLWAIPRYSFLGAALVTVSTEIVVCFLSLFFISRLED